MTKAKGGRGLRAENKRVVTSFTLPPPTLELLRQYAVQNKLSASDMVVSIVNYYSKFRPLKRPAQMPLELSTRLPDSSARLLDEPVT